MMKKTCIPPQKKTYVFFFFFFFFFFTIPPPSPHNPHVKVSLMPGSSIAGSGIQFSMQNTGRLIIPALGGVVIEALGDKVRSC